MLVLRALKSWDWPQIYYGFVYNRTHILLSISFATLHYSHKCCFLVVIVHSPNVLFPNHWQSEASFWAQHSASNTSSELSVRAHVFLRHLQICTAFSPSDSLYIFLLSHEQRLHRGWFAGFDRSRGLLGQVRNTEKVFLCFYAPFCPCQDLRI